MASLNDLKGQLNKLLLDQTEWDYCVVGNGAAALWAAHQALTRKQSVLWLDSDGLYSASRALCSHAWNWAADAADAAALMRAMGESPSAAFPAFEWAYFDARSSKRLRPLSEMKVEWGGHEADYFNAVGELARDGAVDLWAWHERLFRFHNSGELPNSPSTVELFADPRFVRLHRWPVQEIEVGEGAVIQKIGVGLAKGELAWIQARQFLFTDFEENLAGLIKDAGQAEAFGAAFKGRGYRPGFGLRLRHRDFSNPLTQTVIVPLTVSPEKGKAAHLIGRFMGTDAGLESYWAGFLNDEDVEDNNEILKKIKNAKRAVDRALPGFLGSIEREAVTFEPKMFAKPLPKKTLPKKTLNGSERSSGSRAAEKTLGAWVLSDQFGLVPLLKGFTECLKPGESALTLAGSSTPNI